MLTLLEALQKQAKEEPDRIYASYALSADLSDGFRNVTVGELLRAIDVLAWWLHNGWGRSEDFGTVAYVGSSDLRYAIFFYAAIKCGFKTLFISPLNSFEASKSIIESTTCQRIFYAPPMEQVAKTLSSTAAPRAVEVVQIASLEECLMADSTKPYPYEKTFEEAKWDPVVVIHTSGTTGLPKPMTMNFGFFSTVKEPVPPTPGYKDGSFAWFARRTFLGPFPPFHLGGVYTMMTIPVYFEATIVIPPPTLALGETLVAIMHRKKIDLMFSSTLTIEQVMRVSPGGPEKLREMQFISFAGAPLPPWVGDDLSKHTVIKTFFGSTETGLIPTLPPHPDDWPYMKFDPCIGAVLDPCTSPSSPADQNQNQTSPSRTCTTPHELTFPPTTDPAVLAHRGNAWLFPSPPDAPHPPADPSSSSSSGAATPTAAWRSRDLFTPHPLPAKARAGLWRFLGRVDDAVTLACGRRFFPGAWEAAVVRASAAGDGGGDADNGEGGSEGGGGAGGAGTGGTEGGGGRSGGGAVAHCMVVGNGRARPGVLVEPVAELGTGAEAEERFVEEVAWPAVRRANEGVAEEWARVAREMVRVVRPGSLVRAPKGTVVRRASGEGHRGVIEEMYGGPAVEIGL
ncbi:nrps-like enzyme [Diplodia corticola]|uniref:Nrps-like enzyme n=1 Tax=Diplodia corticola TaxID=236234 RepID=A0A1J9QSY2_9PEZI|nr:nrps-like enzyme [Diplodia corticola]OJD31552.1 nrps-like enzyme [Diplodia corticola]